MGNRRLSRLDSLHVLSRQEIRMRQHGLSAEQAEAIEAVRIRHAVAGEHIAMRPIALRTMGLHMAAAFFGDGTETFERRIGAGGMKRGVTTGSTRPS